MSTTNKIVTKDMMPFVQLIEDILMCYGSVADCNECAPGQVVAGVLHRQKYNEGIDAYHRFMDACMVFVANAGIDAVEHADMLSYIYRVAHRNYLRTMTSRHPEAVSPFKDVSFAEKIINDSFKDISITIVPEDVTDPLITYVVSVPRNEGKGMHLLSFMVDKMKICQAAF